MTLPRWVQDLISMSLLKFINTDNSKDGNSCLGGQAIKMETDLKPEAKTDCNKWD